MSGMDLGSVINLIMENPELLAQIKGLVDENEKKNITTPPEPVETASDELPPEVNTEEVPTSNAPGTTKGIRRMSGRRSELLHALSPYISEGRQKALESFMTIADILELMREK